MAPAIPSSKRIPDKKRRSATRSSLLCEDAAAPHANTLLGDKELAGRAPTVMTGGIPAAASTTMCPRADSVSNVVDIAAVGHIPPSAPMRLATERRSPHDRGSGSRTPFRRERTEVTTRGVRLRSDLSVRCPSLFMLVASRDASVAGRHFVPDSRAMLSGKLLHHRDEFVASETAAASEVDEFLHLRDDGAALGGPAHNDRSAAAHFEEALVSKETQRAQHRVGIDLEHGREVFRLGDALARCRFAVGDRAADLSRDLFVEEHWITAIHGRESGPMISGSCSGSLDSAHNTTDTSVSDDDGLGSRIGVRSGDRNR